MTVAIGIEGSANKIGIGILKNTDVLANVRETFFPEKGCGFLPCEVSRHHVGCVHKLIQKAMEISNLKPQDINCICYTKGPGMGAALQAMAVVARTLSLIWNKPVVPVNHCVAHIEMGLMITGAKNPVVLYVSGGNTQVIAFINKKYAIIGETLDIAAGNCIDRCARLLGLSNNPSPGYNMEQEAKNGKEYIPLPYTVKGMDVCLSGVLTAVKDMIAKAKRKKTLLCISDVCFSIQEVIFSMLVEISERAMALLGSDEVIVVGGVGCNIRLHEMIKKMAEERGARAYAMDERYCIDNGAMIARAGMLAYETGYSVNPERASINQRFRTDSVNITWR